MTESKIEWQPTGPLGFPSSKDGRYWIPKLPDGTFRAWYFSSGLPGTHGGKKLGDHLDSIEEAQRRCETHETSVVHLTRLEIHQFLDVFGSEWFIDEHTDMHPSRLEDLGDADKVVFSTGRLAFRGSHPKEVPGLLSLEEVQKIAAMFYPHVPLVPLFLKWRGS